MIERPTGPSQFLFLSFRIYRGGKVEVFPSFHYPALTTVKRGRWTPYGVELRGPHDIVLNAQRVWLSDPHKTLDSAWVDFYKAIPFNDDTARVVFTCSEDKGCEQKDLLAVEVPRNPPDVRITAPKDRKHLTGKVRVTWEAHFDEKPLHFLLRYSNDGGQNWRAVAPSLSAPEHTVDLDSLPGGEKCKFQVLATEGIRTGSAVSEVFGVPPQARKTSIAMPPPGSVFASGERVVFVGDSFSPHFGSAKQSELKWRSSLDGDLGQGNEIGLSTLRVGEHKITLHAPDGLGKESTASIQIEVRAPHPAKHTSLTHPDHTSKDHDHGRIPVGKEGRSK